MKRVLYSTMVCCPFHAAANAHLPDEERYAYNKLFILYVSNDQDFFYQFGNKYEQLPREYVLDVSLVLLCSRCRACFQAWRTTLRAIWVTHYTHSHSCCPVLAFGLTILPMCLSRDVHFSTTTETACTFR